MRRTSIVLLTMIILVACSSGQISSPTEPIATEQTLLPAPISSHSGTVVSSTEAANLSEPSTATPAPVAAPARKDPLPAG